MSPSDEGYGTIYFLTAIGLPPGGSSSVYIYTQTIHRTTQNQQYIEKHKNFWKSLGRAPSLRVIPWQRRDPENEGHDRFHSNQLSTHRRPHRKHHHNHYSQLIITQLIHDK
jgi:hypothetical protein